jgi:hypothetical protein
MQPKFWQTSQKFLAGSLQPPKALRTVTKNPTESIGSKRLRTSQIFALTSLYFLWTGGGGEEGDQQEPNIVV